MLFLAGSSFQIGFMFSSKKKNVLNSKWRQFFIIVALPVISLGLLLFLKYQNQSLPISEFNLFYIGNLINIITVFLFFVGCIILAIRNSKTLLSIKKIILALSWITFGLLILSWIFTIHKIPIPNIYILKQPLAKVLSASFYLVSFFSLTVSLVYIWHVVFKLNSGLLFRTILNSTAIIIGLLVFSFVYIIKGSETLKGIGDTKESRIGVVLGAAVWKNNIPSTMLAARINKAAELYESGKITKIQLTGSNAPGELSEAEVAFNYIKQYKVNLNDVSLETNTTSTSEQIRFIKNELVQQNKYSEIIVISNNYHLSRINQMSKFYNVEIKLIAAKLKLAWDDALYYKIREAIGLLLFWLFAI